MQIAFSWKSCAIIRTVTCASQNPLDPQRHVIIFCGSCFCPASIKISLRWPLSQNSIHAHWSCCTVVDPLPGKLSRLTLYAVGEGCGCGLKGLNARHLGLRPAGWCCGWPLGVLDITSCHCSFHPEKLREEVVAIRSKCTAAGASCRSNNWAQTVRLKKRSKSNIQIIPAKERTETFMKLEKMEQSASKQWSN